MLLFRTIHKRTPVPYHVVHALHTKPSLRDAMAGELSEKAQKKKRKSSLVITNTIPVLVCTVMYVQVATDKHLLPYVMLVDDVILANLLKIKHILDLG